MLLLKGPSVYSTFRLHKLSHKIQAILPHVTTVTAEYIYCVKLLRELSSFETERLATLLVSPELFWVAEDEQLIVVMPRIGTLSPWSSKASDILHNCHVDGVQRVERVIYYRIQMANALALTDAELHRIYPLLHDPMTESIGACLEDMEQLFLSAQPEKLQVINVLQEGRVALSAINQRLGLALSNAEVQYIENYFMKLRRDPTDVELMMFAQANSEHCRHKIFNTIWRSAGVAQPHTLFGMIRHTHQQHPQGTLVAYKDNAAVIHGASGARRFYPSGSKHTYAYHKEDIHILMKVETHNHPTAISPFPGAATGAGGEIRDEGATGRGAKPKAGLCGFSVSDLRIPDLIQPWESDYGYPAHVASALSIMLEGPIGAAAFNNEFGRPTITGYFRTFEQVYLTADGKDVRGYHKPIMLAGGLGNIQAQHVEKQALPARTQIIVLGGPALLIGLGGGAASSMDVGQKDREALDFASVQRDNAEIQRRCQQVIDACWALGADNPILSIHDVGAGGLSNAIPEILHQSHCGGRIELRAIPNADLRMSPLAIWCNEAQERYVLAVPADKVASFISLAQRERCPAAIVGEVSVNDDLLIVGDSQFAEVPIDISLKFLFTDVMLPERELSEAFIDLQDKLEVPWDAVVLQEAVFRVLQLPAVADKTFLITIGDRSVGGYVTRDQMVGPWQVPVADVGVTSADFCGYAGEAMAIGERTPIGVSQHAAAARMAVAEALTNIAAASIAELGSVKLSANWMADMQRLGEDRGLFAAVSAVGMELCPALGIAIPVGKDSMSMRMAWSDGQQHKCVGAPLSLIVSAFAPVVDVRKTLTPQLQHSVDEATDLLFIDLAAGRQRLGASALAQVYNYTSNDTADLVDAGVLKNFFTAVQSLNKRGKLLAYHDRSDGGLFTTLCEMAFASHCGVRIDISALGDNPLAILFNEELGVVLQCLRTERDSILQFLRRYGLAKHTYVIGEIGTDDRVCIVHQGKKVVNETRVALHRAWSLTSYHMQLLRDDPDCAQQAYDGLLDVADKGLHCVLSFSLQDDVAAPYIKRKVKPKVAILREQGVNGHVEMAAAFERVGFTCVDVHMTDIIDRQMSLRGFVGLAVCGGFSYGDVLGAGKGWANTILYNGRVSTEFADFFARSDTFTLGVCNGCQMLSQLRQLIPGAKHWPDFLRNQSEQFEARLSLVEVMPSPSILLQGMAGSRIPIIVSHGEGRAQWDSPKSMREALNNRLLSLCYIDHADQVTQTYPANPNGSAQGAAALTTYDGKVTIMMPHPDRLFRSVQASWHPADWSEASPWLRLFANARAWVG